MIPTQTGTRIDYGALTYPTPEVSSEKKSLTDFEHMLLKVRQHVLTTELNWVRAQLGENPKRCSKCGEELK